MGIEQVGGQGNIPVPAPASQPAPRQGAVAAPSGGTTAAAPPPPQSSAPDLKQLQQAIKQVQSAVQAHASSIEFSLDQGTGETIVKVVDTQTNEVIRQIPSKEMIAIAQSIDQQLQGILLKQKA
jgi:flagellar protein FlaG